MTGVTVAHSHAPILRVVAAGWADPLDSAFSRSGGRWNAPDTFEVLHTCCGERVARAVVEERLSTHGLQVDDLLPEQRPELAEIDWRGEVVDMITEHGVASAGFPDDYPATHLDERGYAETQAAGGRWQSAGAAGVVCRSASLSRSGFSDWSGEHETWGELALFVGNLVEGPRLLRRRPMV